MNLILTIIILVMLCIYLLLDLCVSLNKMVSCKKYRIIHILDSIVDFGLICGVLKIASIIGG